MRNLHNQNTFISLVFNGLITILIGLLFIFASEEIFELIVLLVGILLTSGGVIMLYLGFIKQKNQEQSNPFFQILAGISIVSIGLFIAFNLQLMSNLILLFFGLVLMIGGILQFLLGMQNDFYNNKNKTMIINGLIIFGIGITLAITQQHFVGLIGKFFGWTSILFGALTTILGIYFLLKFKKSQNSESQEIND